MSRAQLTSTDQQNSGGAVAPFVAGKNFLINGGMDWWQRGTSLSFGSFDPRYLADRWLFFVGTANNTLSQETTTVPAGARYAYKWTSTGAGGSFGIYQAIETANTFPLLGKTVTLQAQVTGTTGKTVALQLFYATGTDVTPISVSTLQASGANVSLTSGAFSTVTLTATVPSNARTVKFALVSGDTFANTENIIFGNAQLELGAVATPFARAGGTVQGELALAQRYFFASTTYHYLWSGNTVSGNSYYVNSYLPVQMRTNPTVSSINVNGNSGFNGTTISAGIVSVNMIQFGCTSNNTQNGSYFEGSFYASAEL
jgi:hypothetical protein